MATVGVKVIGPVEGETPLVDCFVLLMLPALGGPISRVDRLASVPVNTIVLVNEADLVPYAVGSSWKVKIPSGTLVVVVTVGGGGVPTLNIAETAQPIQVSGPTIPLDGSFM